MIGGGSTFRLVSRRRLLGLAFGAMHGARRGTGSDVGGSRAYVPGDDPDRINWAASARLSSARGTDEFVVREYFADEAPRAVVVLDRRAAMRSAPGPWLRKDLACEAAAGLVASSVAEARGLLGQLEILDDPTTVRWSPPATGVRERQRVDEPVPATEADVGNGVARALAFLSIHRRAVPAASFVFVLSDFLDPPTLEVWEQALDRGWDVVPVIVQDPVWEQSFPDVDGVAVPLVSPEGARRLVRLKRGESARHRERHAERLGRLEADLASLGIGAVLVSEANDEHILARFLAWSTERQVAWSAAA